MGELGSDQRARVVRERGSPELRHAVGQGTVAVSTAETLSSLPKAEQAAIVAKGEKEILTAAAGPERIAVCSA